MTTKTNTCPHTYFRTTHHTGGDGRPTVQHAQCKTCGAKFIKSDTSNRTYCDSV